MQPELVTKELVNAIEEWRSAGQYDDLALQRIEKQATELKSKEPASAYMLLGMIYCLKDDPDSMRTNHERSLTVLPDDNVLLANYATSLGTMGFYREACDTMNRALDQDPSNTELITQYCGTLMALTRYIGVYDMMCQNNLEDLGKLEASLDDIKARSDVFKKAQVSDDDAEKAMVLVTEVLHNNGYYFHKADDTLMTDGIDAWISIVVRVFRAQSEDAISALNEQLIEQWANNDFVAIDYGAMVTRFTR